MIGNSKSWRWFWVRAMYLIASDSPLARHFAPTPEPPEEEPTDWS